MGEFFGKTDAADTELSWLLAQSELDKVWDEGLCQSKDYECVTWVIVPDLTEVAPKAPDKFHFAECLEVWHDFHSLLKEGQQKIKMIPLTPTSQFFHLHVIKVKDLIIMERLCFSEVEQFPFQIPS